MEYHPRNQRKENAVLIVNRFAGRNQNNRERPVPGSWRYNGEYIQKTLDSYLGLEVFNPDYGRDNFREAVFDAVKKHRDDSSTIIFYGGDDTCENGLTYYMKASQELGVSALKHKIAFMMGGEGVAFKYALGYKNLDHTLDLIISSCNNHARIDVANFNGERYGFIGGFGFFGRVVGEREKTKVSGVKGYIIPAIKTYLNDLFRDGHRTIHYVKDGIEHEVEDTGIGLLISKVRNIGGGFPVIPRAVLNDGKLQVMSYCKIALFYSRYACQEVHVGFMDHVNFCGESRGLQSLHVKVEPLAIDMILDRQKLIENGALRLPVTQDENQPRNEQQ